MITFDTLLNSCMRALKLIFGVTDDLVLHACSYIMAPLLGLNL